MESVSAFRGLQEEPWRCVIEGLFLWGRLLSVESVALALLGLIARVCAPTLDM